MSNRPMLKGKTDFAKAAQLFAANGYLFHLAVTNNSAGAFYAQLWDVKQAGDIGSVEAVPDFEVLVPPGQTVAFPFHKEGWFFGKGLYLRPVTASGGSTVISGNNCKASYQYDSPVIA